MSIKIICMGDSIVVGQFISPALRYTSHLERSLESKYGPDTVQLINQGINGETTRGGLERFPTAVQDGEPYLVTIQYGMNDCNCWQSDHGAPRVSITAFKANLVEMVERSRRFDAKVILCTNHRSQRMARMASGEVYEEANARYSEAVRDVASKTGTTLCDFGAAFTEFGDTELERLLLPAPDSLHLSEAGHTAYAEILHPYVDAAVAAAIVLQPR